jgi:hypothetical protein
MAATKIEWAGQVDRALDGRTWDEAPEVTR